MRKHLFTLPRATTCRPLGEQNIRARRLSISRAGPREREVLGGETEEEGLRVAQRGGSERQDQEEGTMKQIAGRPARQGTHTHPTNDRAIASAARL